MRRLVSASLRLRVAVTVLAALLIVAGSTTVRHARLDVFPEFAPPLVQIQTEGPGLSTSEVETLITVPIENGLNGVSSIETIRSSSVLGLSSVVLYFHDGTDLMQARQFVQERLAIVAKMLPAVASAPVILPPLSATSQIMKIGLSSRTLSQVELTTLAKWTIRPRVMSVPGVANVAMWGQRDRELQILVDPNVLERNGVTLDAVVKAGREAVEYGAGGFIDTLNQRMSVMHRPTIRTAQDLASVPVAFRNGVPLLLGDVARLEEGHPPPIGDAVINDGPGLLFIVEKQPGSNTLDVTRNIESVLNSLKPGLKGVEMDTTIFRPATFIEMSLENLRSALFWGCVLVTIVLVAFLLEWRTAVISLAAIPLSLITAALVIYWRGYTVNTMVLAGMVIALGEVVDDAIIDVENIVRRLRENSTLPEPRPAFDVVLSASLEVRSSVVHATIIVLLVFVPVFFLQGLAGSFFRPLAVSYMLAVLASLAVALTVTPAMALLLLPRMTLARKEPVIARWFKGGYRSLLPAFLTRPGAVLAGVVVLFAVTAVVVPLLGEDFLPVFREYDFLIHFVGKPGASLEAMQRITLRAGREIRAIPGVRNFGAHIGRAEVADEVAGPNFTELWISLDPKAPYESTIARLQHVVDGYPGMYRNVLTYLKERVEEVLSGGEAAIVVRLYGPNLEVLTEKASEVTQAIKGISGVADLMEEPQVMVPQVVVRVKQEAAATFGLTAGAVRRATATLVKGMKIGEIYEDQMIFDVSVWGERESRSDLASLRRIRIDTPSGTTVPLGDLADIRIEQTPNVINHENGSRRIDVSCNVRGRDLGSVAREIETKVKAMSFDRGYHPEILGEYAARQESRERLLSLALLSLAGILVVLYSDFSSGRMTLLLFASLPFALVGSVAAAWIGGGVLSLGSLVGLVTVVGIAARNGIMLVSHFRHLEEQEGMEFGRDLVLRGAEERLVPILMTALITALALLPIVIGGNRPGQEIEHPMAVVILGGLATSTALNLFLMPALYLRFARRARPA